MEVNPRTALEAGLLSVAQPPRVWALVGPV